MSLRVLVVTNMYPTASKPWFGTFVHEQVAALRRAGVQVRVLAFEGGTTNLSYAAAIARVRRQAAGHDVIHAHQALSGAVAVTQRDRPVVTTFHGSDTGRKHWQLHIARRVAARCVPIVVEPSAAVRLRAPRARVLPCGVDLQQFVPRPVAATRRMLGWDNPGPYLLFPSSPRRSVKRYDLFQQCVAAYTARHGSVNTAVLDGADRRQAAMMMSACDAVLMTSDSEGSPVALKEALACCTPVVSVDVGDVRTLIADAPGCSVTTRDPDAMAAAVHRSFAAGRPAELRDRVTAFDNDLLAANLRGIYEQTVTEIHTRDLDIRRFRM